MAIRTITKNCLHMIRRVEKSSQKIKNGGKFDGTQLPSALVNNTYIREVSYNFIDGYI